MLLALLWVPAATADDAFSWGGFGTLGIAYNPSDEFQFIRDGFQSSGIENEVSTKTDSNLGIQLKYRFLSDLEGVVQVVSRHDQDGSFPPEVTWAYLKYAPNPVWDFRVGRMSWDVFMLSDSRNVGYSYLWVRPPREYFGLQQLSHIDGFDIVRTQPLGPGLFQFKLYAGFADEKLPLGFDIDHDLSGSRVLGGHASYQLGSWRFRLGYGEYKIDNEFDLLQPLLDFMRGNNQTSAELADDIQLKNATVQHFVFGTVYERGPFQAQLMLDVTNSETLVIHDFLSGYATLSYRLDRWTPYVSFGHIETDRISRDTGFPPGSPPDQGIRGFLEFLRTDQHTTSLGFRYDFVENMAFKFQVDQLWAHDSFTSLTRTPDFDWDGRGTIVSATLDFIF